MKGFYLNCNRSDALQFINRIDCQFRIDDFPIETGLNGFIINDPFEWSTQPLYHNKEQDLFCACYGWFIYNNKKNNLKEFSIDFTKKRF